MCIHLFGIIQNDPWLVAVMVCGIGFHWFFNLNPLLLPAVLLVWGCIGHAFREQRDRILQLELWCWTSELVWGYRNLRNIDTDFMDAPIFSHKWGIGLLLSTCHVDPLQPPRTTGVWNNPGFSDFYYQALCVNTLHFCLPMIQCWMLLSRGLAWSHCVDVFFRFQSRLLLLTPYHTPLFTTAIKLPRRGFRQNVNPLIPKTWWRNKFVTTITKSSKPTPWRLRCYPANDHRMEHGAGGVTGSPREQQRSEKLKWTGRVNISDMWKPVDFR